MKIQPFLLLCSLYPSFTLIGHSQQAFEFAGFVFDQRNTPDVGKLIGQGVLLGGAQFSAGLPTSTTGIIPNFPKSTIGFNGELGLANITGFGKGGPRAVNLPNGNNGVATRHGIEVSWSDNRGLQNLPGNDIVVFEAASSIASVEGVLARVHSVGTSPADPEQWTGWYYFPPAGFQLDLGAEGEFADAFDFSNMGLSAGAIVDRIQIANLTQADRIEGAGTEIRPGVFVGTGKVVFDGSSKAIPDAGSFDADRVFDATTFDPDPLYLAALHPVVPLGPTFLSILRQADGVDLGIQAGEGRWVVESSENLVPANWQLVERWTNSVAGLNTVKDTGQNGRSKPTEVGSRFYRVKSE